MERLGDVIVRSGAKGRAACQRPTRDSGRAHTIKGPGKARQRCTPNGTLCMQRKITRLAQRSVPDQNGERYHNSIVRLGFEGSRDVGARVALRCERSDQCVASPSQPLRWSTETGLTFLCEGLGVSGDRPSKIALAGSNRGVGSADATLSRSASISQMTASESANSTGGRTSKSEKPH